MCCVVLCCNQAPNIPLPPSPPCNSKEKIEQIYFLGANRGLPISSSLPRSLMLRMRSMAARTFWSGGARPCSICWTMAAVVLHFLASSSCFIVGSHRCRASLMALPTASPTVFGLMISSDRSTLVWNCPMPLALPLAYCS